MGWTTCTSWLVVCSMGFAACGVGEPPPVGDGTPSCADYCEELTNACTGANAQYASHAACMEYCEDAGAFAAGTGEDSDTNTIGCRLFHAGAAGAEPATHCLHAGPTGGGVCGTWCVNYCDLAMAHCTGANALYANRAACETACAAFATTGAQGDADGNTVQCRLFHLGAAAGDASHCAHASSNGGGVCVD